METYLVGNLIRCFDWTILVSVPDANAVKMISRLRNSEHGRAVISKKERKKERMKKSGISTLLL
jgi:hypothetical protein